MYKIACKKCVKYIFVLLIFCTIIINLYSCMHETLSPDETFSMGLIRYNFSKIIYLDSLDVHPPLYYFLLKSFLAITTFYTSSLMIKVIFARILSILLSIVGFVILYRLVKFIGIKQNLFISILFFLFIPYNLTMLQNPVNTDIGSFTNIRMYSLAFMLISAEFYESLKFEYTHKNSNIILTTVFASCASYTHNMSAIIAGLIIFLFMINNIKIKVIAKKFLYSGISFAVLYLPWLPIALKQSKSFKINNNLLFYVLGKCKRMLEAKGFLIHFVLLLLLLAPLIYGIKHFSKKFRDAVYISGLVLIITFIFMTILSPEQKLLYIYPIFGVYIYIVLSVIPDMYQLNIHTLPIIFSIILLFLLFIGGTIEHINQYNSAYLYNQINSCVNTRKPYAKITSPKDTNNNSYAVIVLNNKAIYSEYNGKKIFHANEYNIDNHLAATQSHKLRHYIYDNPLK